MRVIAGEARGVPIKAPKGTSTRPTTDRVRESVFGILGDISGTRVLDLFAGSGALGIEALSRGASRAIFLDIDRSAIKVIKANIEKTKLASKSLVLAVNALKFLGKPEKFLPDSEQEPYNLIFMDPPYASSLYQKSGEALLISAMVAKEALVVVEQSARDPLLLEGAGFILQRSERYGDTVVSFYRLQQ